MWFRRDAARHGLAALLTVAAVLVLAGDVAPPREPRVERDTLARYRPPAGNRLVTNEYVTYKGGDAGSRGARWVANSGSLLSRDGAFWSGVPDSCRPDRNSLRCTNSNVFRVYSRQRFGGNIAVSVAIRLNRELNDPACERADACWHGVHVWLRYRTEEDLYYVSVHRADGNVVIKRKVPCGPENGGTYVELSAYTPHRVPVGRWGQYRFTLRDRPDGAVAIAVHDDNVDRRRPVATGVDRGGRNPNWSRRCTTPRRYSGAGYPPLRTSGSIGIRGDFADFSFGEVTVRRTTGAP